MRLITVLPTYDLETVHVVHLLGPRFAGVPIHFTDRRFGQSKMSQRTDLDAAAHVCTLLFAHC